ncbi:hypothetical protein HYR99_04745 [Candidatus Poribacteria bacterium]|nr:hypothetical protein [Candidatus Poribacteria bacterium]
MTEEQVKAIISHRDASDEIYAVKINDAINKGIAHYWRKEGIDKYKLRVPIYENYLLFLASYLYPSVYERYEFRNYRQALERGVGLCSQHAFILVGFLRENGIRCEPVGLSGHVVVTAQVDKSNDTWWILDPDYGVVIKQSLDEIEKNPEIIRPYYAEKGYDKNSAVTPSVDDLVRIYGKDGNYIGAGRRWGYIESLSYILIWVIPLGLVSPYLITVVVHLFLKFS